VWCIVRFLVPELVRQQQKGLCGLVCHLEGFWEMYVSVLSCRVHLAKYISITI